MSKKTSQYVARHEMPQGPKHGTINPGESLSAAQLKRLGDQEEIDRLEGLGVIEKIDQPAPAAPPKKKAASTKPATKPADDTITAEPDEGGDGEPSDAEIEAKIAALDKDNEDHWTDAGKPDATRLGCGAEQRDRVWKAIQEAEAKAAAGN